MKTDKFDWNKNIQSTGPRNLYRQNLILRILRSSVACGNVLDAGCGNGETGMILTSAGFNVTGVDASPVVADRLKKRIDNLKRKNIWTVACADLHSLPYKDGSFDAVVSGEVLEHLKNDAKAVKEFYRVLRKNGACVVTVPGKPDKWDVCDDISGHLRRYRLDDLKDLFEAAGFRVNLARYYGFPLNGLWHKYIFIPYLIKRMNTKSNDKKTSVPGVDFKYKLIKFISEIFRTDELFDRTGWGNFIILSAQKINQI